MLDQRGQFVRAAVGFATLPLPSYDRALHTLRTWLDSWAGIGQVAVSMARQGSGMEHSPTSAVGAHAVARDAAGGVGGVEGGQLGWLKRSFLGRAGIAGAARIVIIGRGGG